MPVVATRILNSWVLIILMEEERNIEERLEAVLLNFIFGSEETSTRKDSGCCVIIVISRLDFMDIAPMNLIKKGSEHESKRVSRKIR